MKETDSFFMNLNAFYIEQENQRLRALLREAIAVIQDMEERDFDGIRRDDLLYDIGEALGDTPKNHVDFQELIKPLEKQRKLREDVS